MRKAYLLLTSILCLAGAAQASVTVTVNGSNYTLPQKNEKGWGDNVTSWMQAISANTLQPSGGLFSLSADIDLGPLAGVKSLYFKSRSNNIAASGQWRLANTDSIAFRNALNTGDLLLSPGGSDGQLNYNGVLLDTISGANTLTNKKLSDSTLSIVNVTDATKTLGFSLSGNTTGTSLTLAPAQSTSQSLAIPNVSAGDALVTNNTTATLTNKTISGSSNTLSNIPNTATTAVSTNTANAIVARDASGNFSAGTITASLSGNATSANTATTAGNVTGTVAVANGGTGQTTASAAFAALSPAPGSSGNVLTSNGSSWISSTPASAPTSPYEQSNLGLSASVGSSALTISLKQSDGATDPSSGSPVKIGFRSSTASSGAYNQRLVTAALSLTVPSGATLGEQSGVTSNLWIYALDNAGTVELAVSSTLYDDGSINSTTALSGTSNSVTTIYSTISRTNVPIRLIGRAKSNQTTAGTWAAVPTELVTRLVSSETVVATYNGTPTGTLTNAFNKITYPTKIQDTHGSYSSGTFTVSRAGNACFTASVDENGSWSAGNKLRLAIFKNGTEYAQGFQMWSGSTGTTNMNAQVSMCGIPVVQSDTLDARIWSDAASANSFNPSSANYLSITIQ